MFHCATLVIATSMLIGQTEAKEPPQTTIPGEVLTEFEYFVGKWTADYHEGDISGKGVCSNSWSIEKQALVSEQTWEGTPYGTIKAVMLNGWDSAKREVIEATFFSGGGGAVRRYKVESAGVWVGEAQSFHADGAAETSAVRIERKNADEYTWIETNRLKDGQPQPDVRVSFRRVK